MKQDSAPITIQERVRGCLIGGAAGDALGYPVEFLSGNEIVSEYGNNGITEYQIDLISRKALISDDTQMTLFTANGILFWDTRGTLKGVAGPIEDYIALSYRDWLWTQDHKYGERPDFSISWLLDVPELYSRRAPGSTCLAALYRRDPHNTPRSFCETPLNNSKGCGGVMRVAPLGLKRDHILNASHDAAEVAAITHGNPLGYMPAAILAKMIKEIVFEEMSLEDALASGIRTTERIYGSEVGFSELIELLDNAVNLAKNNSTDLENIHLLGEGWVAEEALAIAVYCALRHKDSFSDGIIAAVNHGGDSDSTGAITGNILGAYLGYENIDDRWKKNLELADVILEIADDLTFGCTLIDGFRCEKGWEEKYLYCRKSMRDCDVLNGPRSKDKQILMPDWPCIDCKYRESWRFEGYGYSLWNIRRCDIYDEKPESIRDGICPSFIHFNQKRDPAFDKPIKYIRYTSTICHIKPDWEPTEKTITRIFPDGIVEIRELKGRKEITFCRKKVENSEYAQLVEDIAWMKGGPIPLITDDTSRIATVIFEDGSSKRYSTVPLCLESFVQRLEHNTHYVIKIDL